ncbi:hypothetical protein [Rhizobium sullae]|uniref:hypothetical protein n=1 Tax=Rhizobium sullae TaxID=50338 RepID=UPI000B35B756|nr:hypothetical protein [Rhizobium sullae]
MDNLDTFTPSPTVRQFRPPVITHDIIGYARECNRQPIEVDPMGAQTSLVGGIGSGFHTCASAPRTSTVKAFSNSVALFLGNAGCLDHAKPTSPLLSKATEANTGPLLGRRHTEGGFAR